MSNISIEIFTLIIGILLFVSLLASKTSDKFGVPVLLLFLFIGFAAGSDGLNIIDFNSPKIAQSLGVLTLSVILFSGGMDTKFHEVKPVLFQGMVLATVGVLITAGLTGVFIYFFTNNVGTTVTFTLLEALLLAAVISSTDSASVFVILRSKGMSLKENLRPLLELESGSNDPMAYMLTIILIQLFSAPEINSWHIITTFLLQLILGTLSGFFIGTFAVRIINKINLNNDALYSVLLLAVMFFLLGFTDVIGGNGYLAVYLGGLIIGNHRFVHKRSTQKFFDGLTWLAQIIIFLALGLLVNPSELLPIAVIGSAVGLFLIFAARPAAVFLSLLPFRKMTVRARTFVSWVGLRGAVPIIFATYPLVAEVPHAHEMFNVVFFITIMSLIIQGMQIPNVGKWLKLSSPAPEKHKFNHFDVENFSDEMKSAMREIVVTQNMLSHGNRLMDMNMPENALVAMVKRNEIYFIPRGNTHLEPHDLILVIADSDEKMKETLDSLNNK